MRALIVLAFLLFTPTSLGKVEKADITVLQVNSQWNKQHNIDLNDLRNCNVRFIWLEEQSVVLKRQIQTVPTIVVMKDKKVIRQWAADLSFKLDVDIKEIQQVIDKL